MSEITASIKTNDNHWTVVVDNRSHVFDPSHRCYVALVEAVQSKDAEEFLRLINTGNEISEWSHGNFEFRDGCLFFGHECVANEPTQRMIELIQQGFNHEPMVKYLENLYQNVSSRAVLESYAWSSHKGLPITDDGMMVGYKGVCIHTGKTITVRNGELAEGDLVDIHTRKTFRNNVGDKPSMNRREVCDDHTKGCESGLHIGTYEYASKWAGPSGVIVLVKFNPRDIVSVPSDCSCQKIRVCEYEVIGISREQLQEAVFDNTASEGCVDDEYDFNDDEEVDF